MDATTLHYSILLYSILFYSILFYSIFNIDRKGREGWKEREDDRAQEKQEQE
jgi:hypothetical protein